MPNLQNETVVHALKERARHMPDRIALSFLPARGEPVDVTFAALHEAASSIAIGLRQRLQPGERVLLLYPPGLEFVEAFLAVLYVGAVAVPVPLPHRANRENSAVPKLLADARPAAVLTSRELLARVTEALTSAGSHLLPMTADRTTRSGSGADLALLNRDLALPEPESLAVLQYTSGSTSAPRGVMITHADVAKNAALIAQAARLDTSSVWVSWLPHFHDLGLFGAICTPICGGFRGVLLPPMTVVNQPVRWLEAIAKYRGTMSVAPNFAYELCVARIAKEEAEGLDLSSWRVAGCAAEPIRMQTLRAFAERFAEFGFRPEAQTPFYGLAEATLLVSAGTVGAGQTAIELSPSALREHRAKAPHRSERAVVIPSCGRAAPGFRVTIVEPDTRRPRGTDEIGEIWLTGPTIGRGYWNRPQESAGVFAACLADGTGPFLRTGDLGFVRDGSLYVTGRVKDLMIIRGQNIYPQDLELTAREALPGAGQVVAFALDAVDTGHAVIVLEQPREASLDAGLALQTVRDAIWSAHGVELERIVLTTRGAVPRTSSGKLQRSRARQSLLEGALPVLAEWRADAETLAPKPELSTRALTMLVGFVEQTPSSQSVAVHRYLQELAHEVLGCAPTDLQGDRSLLSLGASSLAMVRLKRRIEADFMIRIEARILWQHADVAELVSHLRGAILGSPLCNNSDLVQQLVAEVLAMSDQEVVRKLAIGDTAIDDTNRETGRRHEGAS
jgi:acyl-CoA synthetase (AMP-forming)/AMP-acid ligase II